MRIYKDFFIWENISRLNSMITYQSLLNDYIKAFREENSTTVAEIRSKMMYQADKIEKCFVAVKMPSLISHGSAETGSRLYSIVQSFPYFVQTSGNTLNRGSDQMGIIKDMYDRAIGIYRSNTLRSFMNTFNPFAYIQYLSDLLFSYILNIFAVPKEKQTEGGWVIVGNTIQLLANIVTILAFLKVTGWDKIIIAFITKN